MSLKNSTDVSPERKTEYLDAVKAVRKGKKGASERLARYVDSGMIRTEEYEQLIERYDAVRSRKKTAYIILCVILLFSLISVAVDYHNNAVETAYNEGKRIGYSEGYDKGQGNGYDLAYGFYEAIKDEYRFYHEYAVRVTTTGKKYHRYNCYHVKDKTFYIYNISMAEAKGYTPCLDCYN